MKIVVFTGSGTSAESGIPTFRDNDGLWNDMEVEDVATLDGFLRNETGVKAFYDHYREKIKSVSPNDAHKLIASLQKNHEVTVITQNVDDLHERGGSKNVIHLHGEITKVRDVHKNIYPYDGKSYYRPHVVWFGECLAQKDINDAYNAIEECELFIQVGTSAVVYPANQMIFSANCPKLYVDLESAGDTIDLFTKCYVGPATSGMKQLIEDFNL